MSCINPDLTINEYLLQFNNNNGNQNSTEMNPTLFTNHFQSFNDNNFVNDISTSGIDIARACFTFQPPSSSLPSRYEPGSPQIFHQMMPRTNTIENTLTNDIETADIITDSLVKEVQVTELAASVIKKRGRPPLSVEVKAAREKDKLENKQAAKHAK